MKKSIFTLMLIFVSMATSVNAADLPEKSLYHFKQKWRNQAGKKVSLESLRGEPQVLTMIYTHCSGTCPLIVETLKKIEKKFSEISTKKIGFVLISMDPERDSPKELKAFAKAHSIKNKNWTLLTSDESSTREFAAALDFTYKKSPNGMFIHQNTIFVLDRDGVLAQQYPDLNDAESEIVKELSLLLG